jgi:choice-of-anchor B domain-containing protein
MNIELVYNWADTTLLPTSAFNNTYNEVWGIAQDGREYAIIGSTAGTHIFDITDTAAISGPLFIPGSDQGTNLIHRDYHDYAGYLYIVADEGGSSTLKVVDVSTLPDSVSVVYSSNALFTTAHNIFIDSAKARLYACGSDYSNIDVISLADPENPTLLLDYDGVGYIHDVYVQNDTAYLNAGGSGLHIVDFTNIASPQILGSLTQYPYKGYNHSGWLSDDGSSYYLADENHGYKMKSIDVSDFGNIGVLDTFYSNVDPSSMAHNLIVKEDYLFVSHYHDGLQIFDISDPSNVLVIGYYDTYLPADHISYRGAWGVYPLLPSGLVLVSDMQTGLYVLDVSGAVCYNPSVGFSSSVQNSEVDFTDMSNISGPATYSWDFGDGVGNSAGQNPNYTYLDTGTFTVCLIVTDSCGTNTLCKDVSISNTTAIHFSNGHLNWGISPNPFSNHFALRFSTEIHEEIEYSIYDVSGKRVLYGQGFCQHGKLNIPDVAKLFPGIYIIELNVQDYIWRKKIVKSLSAQ